LFSDSTNCQCGKTGLRTYDIALLPDLIRIWTSHSFSTMAKVSGRLQSMRFMARGTPKATVTSGGGAQTWTDSSGIDAPESSSITPMTSESDSLSSSAPVALAGNKRRLFRAVVDSDSTVDYDGTITLDGVTGFRGRMSFQKFNVDVDKKSKAHAEAEVSNGLSDANKRARNPPAMHAELNSADSPGQHTERIASRPQTVYGSGRRNSQGKPHRDSPDRPTAGRPSKHH
jgi:hypothetical protein